VLYSLETYLGLHKNILELHLFSDFSDGLNNSEIHSKLC